MIPLSAPNLNGKEVELLQKCIETGWLSTSGEFVNDFENKIANFSKSKYAIACNSGTAAIHIALKVLGVMPEDEVIVPTLTFIAPINAVRYNLASPIFMDCDDFYNIDVEKTIEFIKSETEFKEGYSYNKKTGRRVFAIIPVHVWGNAVWLDELVKICRDRNILILEDASESIGSRYTSGEFTEKHTGTIGEMGCLSFNANKTMTTGGGGMILTNNKLLAEKSLYLISQAKDDSINYIHNEIGYNYRLTNLHAAIGISQIDRLQDFLKRKKEIHYFYSKNIDKLNGFSISKTPSYSINNHWLNILKIDRKIKNICKNSIIKTFQKNRIQVRPVWYLNHLQKPYLKYQNFKIERAISLLEESICLPSSSNLKEADQEKIIHILEEFDS